MRWHIAIVVFASVVTVAGALPARADVYTWNTDDEAADNHEDFDADVWGASKNLDPAEAPPFSLSNWDSPSDPAGFSRVPGPVDTAKFDGGGVRHPPQPLYIEQPQTVRDLEIAHISRFSPILGRDDGSLTLVSGDITFSDSLRGSTREFHLGVPLTLEADGLWEIGTLRGKLGVGDLSAAGKTVTKTGVGILDISDGTLGRYVHQQSGAHLEGNLTLDNDDPDQGALTVEEGFVEIRFDSVEAPNAGGHLFVDGPAADAPDNDPGLVIDSGGEADFAGDTVVGRDQAGRVLVQEDSGLASDSATLGAQPGSRGRAVVKGNSVWNVDELTVGDEGTGTLTIADGQVRAQTLSVNDWSSIELNHQAGILTTPQVSQQVVNRLNWTAGTLELTGADGATIGTGQPLGVSLALNADQQLEVDHKLTVEADGTLLHGGELAVGSAEIASGGQMLLGAGTHGPGSGLTNRGELVFNKTATITGPVTNAEGATVTAVGDVTFQGEVTGPGGFYGAGTVTFEGGYSPGDVFFESEVMLGESNTLTMELAGLNAGSGYDQLEILGELIADGMLNLELLDGFTPSPGDTFKLFRAGAFSGSFDTVPAGRLQLARVQPDPQRQGAFGFNRHRAAFTERGSVSAAAAR